MDKKFQKKRIITKEKILQLEIEVQDANYDEAGKPIHDEAINDIDQETGDYVVPPHLEGIFNSYLLEDEITEENE